VDRVIARVPAATAETVPESAWRFGVQAAVEAVIRDPSRRVSNPFRPEFYDITPDISPRLGVWPGDTPPSREVLCEIDRGDSVTLSTLRATVHLGAHADAPNHYYKNGNDIASQPLYHYLGPSQVIEIRIARGSRIRPEDIPGGLATIQYPRVLFKTGTFPDPEAWNADFSALSPELIDALAALQLPEMGVCTVGIDTPSVDLQDSKDLPAHKAILRWGIAILEGLRLTDVPPGAYELIALPLRLSFFDASPVRAVLRPL
jgi:arylformamidase